MTQFIALRALCRGSRASAYSRACNVAGQSRWRTTGHSEPTNLCRSFSTNIRPRARNDDSTIDFAYLPDANVDPEPPETYRVPILPTNYRESIPGAAEAEDEVVMKPQISTMSADAVFQPMADLSDGHAMNIDFHAMAEKVAGNLRNKKMAPEEQASMIKQIFGDLVDDMLGLNKKSSGGR